jgi:hypothetical protein
VKVAAFTGDALDQVTIYVLLGKTEGTTAVRYFIVRNRDAAEHVHRPPNWNNNGFINMKAVEAHEDKWEVLLG